MELPQVPYRDKIRKYKQLRFEGLDRRLGTGDGTLQEMQNLCSDHYPLLATRGQRFKSGTVNNDDGALTSLFCWNDICWTRGTGFCYAKPNVIAVGEEYYLKGEVAEGDKNYAAVNDTILILPDMKYYNEETDTFGDVIRRVETLGTVTERHEDDPLDTPHTFTSTQGVMWEEYYAVGDQVEITWTVNGESHTQTSTVRKIMGTSLLVDDEAYEPAPDEQEDGSSLAPPPMPPMEGSITVERKAPRLLFACERDNRVWGCDEKTVYASRLGDILNWYSYQGLETDSWTVEVISAGVFTGAVNYGGYPLFFKEDQIIKIYGDSPSSFSMVSTQAAGVARGSERSLAVVDGTLFYLSPEGVMAYTGGMPQCISAELGNRRFQNGAAGSMDGKYYISMQEVDTGTWGLYVYDTRCRCWHKEDNTHATHFAKRMGGLYFLERESYGGDGSTWIIGKEEQIRVNEKESFPKKEGPVSWVAEFSDFTHDDPNKKRPGKIQIRLELEEGANAQVWAQYDSDGVWRPVGAELTADVKRSYYLPVTPRRCDHYRLKITGTGMCRIYSVTREVAPGSEMKSKQGRT